MFTLTLMLLIPALGLLGNAMLDRGDPIGYDLHITENKQGSFNLSIVPVYGLAPIVLFPVVAFILGLICFSIIGLGDASLVMFSQATDLLITPGGYSSYSSIFSFLPDWIVQIGAFIDMVALIIIGSILYFLAGVVSLIAYPFIIWFI